MATRMDETDTSTRMDRTGRPLIWPWVVLAVVIVAALWWAAANNAKHNAVGNTYNEPGMSTPAPGNGTGETGTGATGTGPTGTDTTGTGAGTIPSTTPPSTTPNEPATPSTR